MIPKVMKALVKEEETTSYRYKQIPVPLPEAGDLLVKVRKVALCGSDISLYQWNEVAKVVAKVPFSPGHEMVGEIVAVGPDVPSDYAVGKRVCVENHFYCGDCYQCRHDQRHICQRLNQFGHGKGTIHGGCSEYTIIPARYAYLLSTDITDSQAAVLEPFGVAHQALEEIEPSKETVLIIGCGPVGLLATGIAKAMGAAKIIVIDIIKKKLEIAKIMGADIVVDGTQQNLKEVVMNETNGDGVGRIVDASGVSSIVNNCFTMLSCQSLVFVRKGGKIVLIGLLKAPLHVENPLQNIVFKSITLKTVHGRKIFHSWKESEKLIYEKKVNVDILITHDIAMSEFEKAFKILTSGEGCKILLSPQE